MSGWRSVLAWWPLGVTVALWGTARAQDGSDPGIPTRLALVAPDRCPGREVLEQEVASLLGRPADDITLPATLDPTITIGEEEGRYVLVVRDGDETRTLRDGSCAALVRAAALIIALRIDADAATLAAATATAIAEPEEESQPTRPRRRRHYVFEWSQRLARPFPPRRLPNVALGAGIVVEGGIVPVVAPAIAADVVFRLDRFEARVRAAYVIEQGQVSRTGIAASAILGTALLCGRPFDVELPLAFCGGAEAGPLFARSYGVSVPGSGFPWTLALVAGVWLPLFPWNGLDVSLGAEAWVRLVRPEFDIAGLGRVWDSDLVGGRFALLVHFHP